MNILAAIVLFLVLWFLTLFVVLPLRLRSQDEAGDVVPGTPGSAPVAPGLKRKFMLVTIISALLWGIVMAILLSGVIGIADIDILGLYGRGYY